LQLLRQLRGGDVLAIGCRPDVPSDHASAAWLATVIGYGRFQLGPAFANSEHIDLRGAGFTMNLQFEAIFQEFLKHQRDLVFPGVAGDFGEYLEARDYARVFGRLRQPARTG
jgi:hypothetical protein